MGRKCVQALAAGLGIYFAPAARLSSAADPGGPCAAAIDLNLDDLKPSGRSFAQLHYLVGLGLVADDLC